MRHIVIRSPLFITLYAAFRWLINCGYLRCMPWLFCCFYVTHFGGSVILFSTTLMAGILFSPYMHKSAYGYFTFNYSRCRVSFHLLAGNATSPCLVLYLFIYLFMNNILTRYDFTCKKLCTKYKINNGDLPTGRAHTYAYKLHNIFRRIFKNIKTKT